LQKIKQAIVTEGKFDRAKLNSVFDAVIIETNGFGVFRNRETQELIRHFARETGIIVLTDSDPAGLKIRYFVNDLVKEGTVINAYVPVVYGKEKRKDRPGAAGMLGVEGIDDDVIARAVTEAAGMYGADEPCDPVTSAELYEAGLSGRTDSAARRKRFLEEHGLPGGLSKKQMLSYLNRVPGPDGFREMLMEEKQLNKA